jgi:hypothetical protein
MHRLLHLLVALGELFCPPFKRRSRAGQAAVGLLAVALVAVLVVWLLVQMILTFTPTTAPYMQHLTAQEGAWGVAYHRLPISRGDNGPVPPTSGRQREALSTMREEPATGHRAPKTPLRTPGLSSAPMGPRTGSGPRLLHIYSVSPGTGVSHVRASGSPVHLREA